MPDAQKRLHWLKISAGKKHLEWHTELAMKAEREEGRKERKGIDVLIRMSPAAAENKGGAARGICLFLFVLSSAAVVRE